MSVISTLHRPFISKTEHLVEADCVGFLAEALTAKVKTVLADETGLVGAKAATENESVTILFALAPRMQLDESATHH